MRQLIKCIGIAFGIGCAAILILAVIASSPTTAPISSPARVSSAVQEPSPGQALPAERALRAAQAKDVAAEWALPTLPCTLDPNSAILVQGMNPAELVSMNESRETKADYIREDTKSLERIMDSIGPACTQHGFTQCPNIGNKQYHDTAAQRLCFAAYDIRELRAEITIASLPPEDAALGQALSDKITAENRRGAYASEPPALGQYEETIDSINARVQVYTASLGCSKESWSASCGHATAALSKEIFEQASRRYCASGDKTLRGSGSNMCQQTK